MSESQSLYFTESERTRNLQIVKSFEYLFECQDSLRLIENCKSEEFKRTTKGLYDLIVINIDDILFSKTKVELALVICLLSNIDKLMNEFIVSDGNLAMKVYTKLYMAKGILEYLKNELETIKAENYRFA